MCRVFADIFNKLLVTLACVDPHYTLLEIFPYFLDPKRTTVPMVGQCLDAFERVFALASDRPGTCLAMFAS